MCGIFGFVSKKQKSASVILEGLRSLEYRGYDSWGIAIKKGAEIEIEKHIGKIGVAKTSLTSTTLGIGHTRWATHGGVTAKNAHPHLDCSGQIALLHNGIIENFEELKADLLTLGHKFVSQTDTEVAVHLIEEELKTNNFALSVKNAFKKLHGMNAIVVMNSKSSEIIAAKNGSPLVVGKSLDGYFLASDAAGIIKHTKKVMFVEDNQMIIVGKTLQIINLLTEKKIKPKYTTLSWKFEKSELGNFKHYFIKETHEEQKVINFIARNSQKDAIELSNYIKQAKGIFLVACGSASYAAIGATYLFSKIARLHVNFAIGSEFKYSEDFVNSKTLLIPISQSGESIDVIEPVTRMKKKGVKVASIVNVEGSTLFRISEYAALLNSGPEKAVVATKSFTAMLAMLILTAFTYAGGEKKGKYILQKAAVNVGDILTPSYIKRVEKLAVHLNKSEHIYIIGRGFSYTAALETALKLKEGSFIHAEAFPGGELKHGVMALIEKGTPVIVFAPNDETYAEIISNAQEVKARGAYVVGIGPLNNSVFDDFLPTADIEEATILPQVTIAHLLGYYVALARKVPDPDKPRNLAKSVTVK